MSKYLLVCTAREGSSRCPRKHVRPFAGTTLFDIYLPKFRALLGTGIFSRYMMFIPSEEDADLCAKAREAGFDVTHEIQGDKKLLTCFQPLRDYTEDFVVWFNPCLPLFPWERVREGVSRFDREDSALSMTTVCERRNWFWTPDGQPVSGQNPLILATQDSPPLLESCHAFHVFPRERYLSLGCYWMWASKMDPMMFIVPEEEAVDVDDERDFLVAEALYRASGSGGGDRSQSQR